jgi:nucleoside-diphosphate-sugar epimerase
LRSIPDLVVVSTDSENWPKEIAKSHGAALILADWWGVANAVRNDSHQYENISRYESLVSAAVKSGFSIIVGMGSQAEFGNVETVIPESQPDSPTTEYGKAKVIARENLFKAVAKTTVRPLWMRIFATYGPLDDGDWLIPSIVRKSSLNVPVELTLGEQYWSYLHAADLATAFLRAIESGTTRGIVNVGHPQPIHIREIAEIVADYFDNRDNLKFGVVPYRPDQVMRLEPICETLTSLEWKPQYSMQNGMTQTIQWLMGESVGPIKIAECGDKEVEIPLKL